MTGTGNARAFVVAVDGPSAAGKGTLARRLAARLGFAFLDSGLLYRAAALRLLRGGRDPGDAPAAAAAATAVEMADLGDPELRSEAIAQAASQVAAIPAVRQALLGLQRAYAARPPAIPGAIPGAGAAAGIVIDGRDIGTVVCPDADVKIFVTASVEERARRRHKELLDRGDEAIYSRVLQDMKDRDARDSGRAASPLVPAADAIVIDSTALDADAAFAAALALVDDRRHKAVRV